MSAVSGSGAASTRRWPLAPKPAVLSSSMSSYGAGTVTSSNVVGNGSRGAQTAANAASRGSTMSKSSMRGRHVVILLLVGATGGLIGAVGLLIWRRWQRRTLALEAARAEHLHHQSVRNQQYHIWDVIVVGAGPAGATCAFYCARSNLRVLLLDRERFPRDKICGDQVHTQAQHILKDMGVLQHLIAEDAVRWAVNRGVVSPAGHSFVGEIKEKDGLLSVQRVVLDEKVVEAAVREGVSFKDSTQVKAATFDRLHGEWALDIVDLNALSEPERTSETSRLLCRVLVCADGASSSLARSLQGLTQAESPAPSLGHPNSIGGRAFAKRHTHDCRADEVIFYPGSLLPGHVRMSGELDDYLNISCFVLPHPDSPSQSFQQYLSPQSLLEKFQILSEKEIWIRKTLGPRCKLSRLQTAPLRVGGVPKSFFPHGLIVGDAAGHQDPMTGDGLQYGMRAAQLAATTIVEAYRKNDFSLNTFRKYDKAWRSLFGWDFFWAKGIVYLMAQIPRLIDAVTIVIQRKGTQAILFWALARSGVKSKFDVILWFLRPDTFWEIVWRWISLWAQQEF